MDIQYKNEETVNMSKEAEMAENAEKTRGTRRIGSFTFGCVLVLFGCLFLLHQVFPILSYRFIFQLWPCILIFLGIEVLVANGKKYTEFRYDKGAVFMLVVLTFFSMAMAWTDWAMEMAILHSWY